MIPSTMLLSALAAVAFESVILLFCATTVMLRDILCIGINIT